MVVAATLALSLSIGGITAVAAGYPPSDDITPVIPVFTTQPQHQAVIPGQDVVFSVAISGYPAPALQWQVSIDGGITWINIDGQTGSILRLLSVNLTQSGNLYRLVAANSAGEVVSGTANLVVSTLTNAAVPNITTQPQNSTVTTNNTVTLSVTAEISDRGTLTYQWFQNTSNRNSGGTAVQGATGRTFTPPTAQNGIMYYYAVITNTNNNVNGTATASTASNAARITVNPLVNALKPEILVAPENIEVAITARRIQAELSVTARTSDSGILSFQWYTSETGSNTGGTPIRGATGRFFTPPTDEVGITYYYVVVTNTNNDVNGRITATNSSQAVTVNVFTTPGTPENLETAVDGSNITLRWEAPAENGGSEIIGYQVSDNIVTIRIDANGEYEHTFENLFPGREYTLKVRAVNAAGAGEEAAASATTEEAEIEEEADEEEYAIYDYLTSDDYNNFPFFWIGLGTLAPLGAGTGLIIRKKLKNKKSRKNNSRTSKI